MDSDTDALLVPVWALQHRPASSNGGLRVGECEVGRGLFAERGFRAGERILVFRGPRFHRNDPIHDTDQAGNLLQTGTRTYILPEPPGLFVNHSCNPNAGITRGRRLIALRDVSRNEEIRFDYSTTMDEDYWTMECRCGQPTCRRVVDDFKRLPSEARSYYINLGVVPRFILSKLR